MDVGLRERGIYAFGPFRLDPLRRTLLRDGAAVALTARLFETLLYLVQHSGRLVERDELEHAVWQGRAVEEGNLQKAVSSLRKVLQAEGTVQAYIVTVQGRGFQFSVPVAFEPDEAGAPDDLVFASRKAASELPASPWFWAGWTSLTPRAVILASAAIGVAGLLILGLAIAGGGAFRRVVPAGPDAAFAPPPHSVAVLSFANMSGDARQDYFSDGLADQLINTLGRIGDLRVAARTSAFSFKGGHATIGEIGRRLNVAAVLEGSVRQDGSRVHIVVQLVDARSGFEFWSRSYDRDRFSDDMAQLQTDIAETVAGSLEVKLMGAEAAELTDGGTRSARAFDAYLRGTSGNQAMDKASARQAIVDFGEAIALDPGYALAFAGRAEAHNFIAITGYGTDAGNDDQERAAAATDAARAVQLAPMLAETHRMLGFVLFTKLDFTGAAREITRARELAPDNALIEATSGQIEARLGHARLAMASSHRAIALDPLNPSAYRRLGGVLYWTRHFTEALEAFGHANTLDRNPSRIKLSWSASVYLAAGQPAAAERLCVGGREWTDYACLAIAYHALGRQAEAESELATLRQIMGERAAFVYAQIYAQWGQPANALQWLETAATLRDPGLHELKVSPFLDPIRQLAEFNAIEGRMNFPP